jgi:putative phosphotransacetylase
MDVEKITQKVLTMIERSKKPIVANISNRHAHLTKEHFEALFGKEAQLTIYRELLQPGQFAANEVVTILGPKGKFEKVRIVGPLRKYTQVEISKTDSFVLGLAPPVRDSGDIKNSSPITLIGPNGKLQLNEGCIIAWRHIHFTPEDAKEFDIKDKELVRIRAGIGTERELVFENVLCRVGENMRLECHLDTDEANACGLKSGDSIFIL